MKEFVVLVDEKDQEIGQMEKMEAHEKGLLHRAFSVFLFNAKGEMLLQQRAKSKYHSPLLWTNTCCSHPRVKESNSEAAHRRLDEEMGMTSEMKHAFHFLYHVKLDKGLTEHELDHVFIGHTNNLPIINPEEVEAYKFIDIPSLIQDVKIHPENYTEWFKICLEEVLERM